MSAAEIHKTGIQFFGSRSTGRHVGIIGPHDLHPRKIHPLKRFEIRPPSVFSTKVISDYLCLDQSGSGRICGIAGIRHQHLVSLVKKCHGDQQYGLLGAHQRLDFPCRVKADPIPTGIPVCKSLPEFRKSHITLICMVSCLMRTFTQCIHSLQRRHSIRRAYAKVYDRFLATFKTLGIHPGDFLEFSGKIIFLNRLRPLCWSYYHIADLYSPKIFRSSISGLTAATACSYLT